MALRDQDLHAFVAGLGELEKHKSAQGLGFLEYGAIRKLGGLVYGDGADG